LEQASCKLYPLIAYEAAWECGYTLQSPGNRLYLHCNNVIVININHSLFCHLSCKV